MNIENLAKEIVEQAKKFKLRAAKSHVDEKRHDLVNPDERKAMYKASDKLGWSNAKIASEFGRDTRTVKMSVKTEQGILDKHEKYKQQGEQQLIQERQKEHIKKLQELSRTALDHLPLFFLISIEPLTHYYLRNSTLRWSK